MPQPKSGAGPGQDFQISPFSNFLDLVRSKFLVIRGRSRARLGAKNGARFLADIGHDFVSHFQESGQNGLA